MSEFAGFDLDRTTARAWSRFQARLADHIAEMGDEDTLIVDAEVSECVEHGAAPYVQFAGFGDGSMVRGEVSSNEYLTDQHRLSDTQCAEMTDLGWQMPTLVEGETTGRGSANFFADLPVTEADRLAVMSVRALRDVLGVAHPAFLSADVLGPDPEAPVVGPEAVDTEHDEASAVMPESEDHLRDLVDAALLPLFGSAPEKDDDGDIPVPCGSSLVFVRVEQDVPIVQIFSIVVEGVTDRERALFEVNVLNRDLRFIKFVLVGDRVLALVHLPAWPFVPEHLRSMLTGMSQKIDEVDEDLVARIGGRRAFEPSPDLDEEPEEGAPVEAVTTEVTREISLDVALQTLLQLDAEARGLLDPDLAASVCGHDQELIVRLLRQTEEQEVAWRSSRDRSMLEGDTDDVAACEHELGAWEQTTSLLRRTLRLVVERGLGRDPRPGAPYSGGTGRGDDRGSDDGLDRGEEEAAATRGAPRPTPRMRKALPPKPLPPIPVLGAVAGADDLLAVYAADDLLELDVRLSEEAAFPVEVFDLGDSLEVHVAEQVWTLDYPFAVEELRDLLRMLGGDSRPPGPG